MKERLSIDLPSLSSIVLGGGAFDDSSKTVFSNLGQLRTISLGENAIRGKSCDDCSLILFSK